MEVKEIPQKKPEEEFNELEEEMYFNINEANLLETEHLQSFRGS